MNMEFPKHSNQLNAEAADWFTLLASGSATQQQHHQLERWLAASDEHREAYQQLTVIWGDLATLSESEEGVLLRPSVEKGHVDRFFTEFGASLQQQLSNFSLRPPLALALFTVVMISSVLFLSQPMPVVVDSYVTGIGEMKTITLADGSQVTLGANSAIEAWSDDAERHVVLASGQAFFEVATDPARPFWVAAQNTRVKVVGTKFDVRYSLDRVRVAVSEGVVNVTSAKPVDDHSSVDGDLAGASNAQALVPTIVLRAGQQVIKPRALGFQSVKPISEHELSAWRRGRLVYLDASIVDVVADANRYFEGTITLNGAELSALKVTAAIGIDQIAFLPDMLAQTLPVVVQKSGNSKILISHRDKSSL